MLHESRNIDVIRSDTASIQQNLLWRSVGHLVDTVKGQQTDSLNLLKAVTYQRVSQRPFHQDLLQSFLLQL